MANRPKPSNRREICLSNFCGNGFEIIIQINMLKSQKTLIFFEFGNRREVWKKKSISVNIDSSENDILTKYNPPPSIVEPPLRMLNSRVKYKTKKKP